MSITDLLIATFGIRKLPVGLDLTSVVLALATLIPPRFVCKASAGTTPPDGREGGIASHDQSTAEGR